MSLVKFPLFTFAANKLRKRVRTFERSTLADAPEGVPVRIHGVIRELAPAATLAGPLTRARCVHYAACVDLDIVGALTMEPYVRRSASVPFLLDDGRELAYVDPTHSLVSSRFDHATRSKAAWDAGPHQRDLLRFATHEPIWFRVIAISYYESVLRVGQEIVLLGAGTREAAPGGHAYRDTATRMHFAGTEANPLILCDYPDKL